MYPIDPNFYLGASASLSALTMVLSCISSIVSLVVYILNAIAIMNFCKKLSIPNGWLGFIPFASTFKLGQVADKYCEYNGEKKKFASLLLILEIVVSILVIPVIITLSIFIIGVSSSGAFLGEGEMAVSMIFPVVIVLLSFLLLAASIVYLIFSYIAHYKIFKLFIPNSAVLFIVLMIFVGFNWLFLLISSFKSPNIPQPIYPENEQKQPIYTNYEQ